MNIVFGLALDGHERLVPQNCLDSTVCGPLGLVHLLETRFGLAHPPVSRPLRTAQYCKLLEAEAKTRAVFYQKSIEKDAYAVAETLLQWRDALVEAGWDGTAAAGDTQRLQDLAAVEARATGILAPGLPDRLHLVLRELDVCSAHVDSLTALDEKRFLPTLWQRLFDKLGATYRPADAALAKSSAANDTDLGMIQQALTSTKPGKVTPKGDRSVVFLTANSELTLARATAQWLSHLRCSKDGAATLIAGGTAGVLDQALAALDEPMTGIVPFSTARPIPQVLLLALRLYWKPLDPRALLEFLTHPVSPVNSFLRYELAQTVSACPGIGGAQWNAAVDEAKERVRKAYADDADKQRDTLQRIDNDLKQWLLAPRFDPADGAPGALLSECCAGVARWAGGRAGVSNASPADIEQFRVLSSLASELSELLKAHATVKRSMLERILRQTSAAGWQTSCAPAELQHVHRVESPAALLEPADTIVWWDFSERSVSFGPPWTIEEQQQLTAHGVHILAPELLVEREALLALRPLLAARRRLVLVTPRQRGGEIVARHPLYTRLMSLLEQGTSLPANDVDRELAAAQACPPLALAVLPYQPLPALQRWWQLGKPQYLEPRAEESYSSIEKFVYSPYAWVFRYKARLQAGPLSTARLQDTSRQKGTLLHRLFDLLLQATPNEIDWRTTGKDELQRWVETQWPALLEQEGANLLLPGHHSEAVEFRETGKRALWNLLEQLRVAGIVMAHSNVTMPPKPFVGGQLGGILDLQVENSTGHTAVIDLKLGGRDTREKELKQNRPLQLAVYGYLLRETNSGEWPAAAFYLLGSQRLIAQSREYFPDARIITADPPGDIADCWAAFETVWRWRRALLDKGSIEFTVPGTTLDPEDPHIPLPHWQATEDHSKYNDYDALMGWGAQA